MKVDLERICLGTDVDDMVVTFFNFVPYKKALIFQYSNCSQSQLHFPNTLILKNRLKIISGIINQGAMASTMQAMTIVEINLNIFYCFE